MERFISQLIFKIELWFFSEDLLDQRFSKYFVRLSGYKRHTCKNFKNVNCFVFLVYYYFSSSCSFSSFSIYLSYNLKGLRYLWMLSSLLFFYPTTNEFTMILKRPFDWLISIEKWYKNSVTWWIFLKTFEYYYNIKKTFRLINFPRKMI